MSLNTDYLRLNEQKIIKNIRESLPEGIYRTLNLLTVCEDVLFIWNSQDSCVLTLNIKAVKSRDGDSVSYQKLLPHNPPCFAAELLRVNTSCNLLAVAGPLGLIIMELPRRTTPHGQFSGDKEIVYCKSYSLDERLFSHSKVSEVRQMRWHPGSISDCHLLVLTSDNMFRLYKVNANDSANLVRVFQIGVQPTGILPGTRLPFLAGLGETGVDFDFGVPSAPEDSKDWEDLDWPVYILRGDGEIFTMILDINDKKSPKIKGPLMMCPDADDSTYGNDACAIICFKTTPPVLAISTTTGTIYHCILLPPNDNSDLEASKTVIKHKSYSIHPSDKVLYVFESIELELGISVSDSDCAYSCPIFLHPDQSTKGRYFCTHETGVHVVNIPIVTELEKFVKADEKDLDICLPTLKTPSSAEYILCTHATGLSKVNPVLGFALFHCPTALIALLATGQIVSLPLVSILLPTTDINLLNSEMTSPLKKMLNEPFDSYIKQFLKNEVNQPILHLRGTDPELKESFDLLSRTISVFRNDYFKRYDRIREELEKRVKALQLVKDQQKKDLQKLSKDKQQLQETAEKLAEKYEEIQERQEDLTKRCERLLISVTQKQPKPTDSENNLYRDLKKADEKIKAYSKAMDQIKSKQKYQEIQMANWNKQQKKKEVHLGSDQSESIKTTLQDMTKQVTEMMNQIKKYKDELGLE